MYVKWIMCYWKGTSDICYWWLWSFCSDYLVWDVEIFWKNLNFKTQPNWNLVSQLAMHIHKWSHQIFKIWYVNNGWYFSLNHECLLIFSQPSYQLQNSRLWGEIHFDVFHLYILILTRITNVWQQNKADNMIFVVLEFLQKGKNLYQTPERWRQQSWIQSR